MTDSYQKQLWRQHKERQARFAAAARRVVTKVETITIAKPVPPPYSPPQNVIILKEPPLSMHVTKVNSLKQLLLQVAYKYGVSTADIKGPKRTLKIMDARAEFCYRAAAETNFSYPIIAALINRDHTTVMSAMQRHAKVCNLPIIRRKVGAPTLP